MSFPGDLTTDTLGMAMLGLSARQRVLSQNLANADTPGYKRMDISFEGALADAVREERAKGGGSLGQDPRFAAIEARLRPTRDSGLDEPVSSLEGSPQNTLRVDGSNVDPDQEMAELSANSLTYETVTGLLRKHLSTIRTALG